MTKNEIKKNSNEVDSTCEEVPTKRYQNKRNRLDDSCTTPPDPKKQFASLSPNESRDGTLNGVTTERTKTDSDTKKCHSSLMGSHSLSTATKEVHSRPEPDQVAMNDVNNACSAAVGSWQEGPYGTSFNVPNQRLEMDELKSVEPETEYKPGGYLRVHTGEVLNSRYAIIRKLGYGSYSTVWMARDTETRNYVAVKIAKSEETYAERAESEIKFMKIAREQDSSHCGHKRVMHLLSDFTMEGMKGKHVALVFEILGPTLHNIQNHSNQHRFHLEQVRKICKQILEGLDYLHTECKIVHCDLKPENIMITISNNDIKRMDSGNSVHCDNKSSNMSFDVDFLDPNCDINIKLGDLGIACNKDEKVNRRIQSCYYRSPEAFFRVQIGTSADMWSFGCLLYEIIIRRVLLGCKTSTPERTHNLEHFRRMAAFLGPLPSAPFKGSQLFCIYFDDDGCFREKSNPDELLSLKQIAMENYMSEDSAALFSNILLSVLQYDPKQRLTAKEALQHQFLALHGIQTVATPVPKVPEEIDKQSTANCPLETPPWQTKTPAFYYFERRCVSN